MRRILVFDFPSVANRRMVSSVTPDSVEKAITQPRKAHSVHGLGLLILSFSTLGTFFAFFFAFFWTVPDTVTRRYLLGHRDLSFVCLERYLAS